MMSVTPVFLSLLMAASSLPNATAPVPSSERALVAALTQRVVAAQVAQATPAPTHLPSIHQQGVRTPPAPTPNAPSTVQVVNQPTNQPQPNTVINPTGGVPAAVQPAAQPYIPATAQTITQPTAQPNAQLQPSQVVAPAVSPAPRLANPRQNQRLASTPVQNNTLPNQIKNKGAKPRFNSLGRRLQIENKISQQPKDAPDEISAAIRMAGFAVVLAIFLFGAAFLLKKFRRTQVDAQGGPSLSVLESLWIGKGQRILLVNVDNQQVLLAATSTGISSLAVFPNEARIPAVGPTQIQPTGQTFESVIKEELSLPVETPAPVSQEHVQKLIRRLNTL